MFMLIVLTFYYLCITDRSVYDDQPNAHQKFMEKLDACIRNHDREIEKMCNFHHQGFVDAITELLKVRADAEKLKVRYCCCTCNCQKVKCGFVLCFEIFIIAYSSYS